MKKISGAVANIPFVSSITEYVEPPIWGSSIHEELKTEFLAVYKNDFPPEHLEHLAHAYANVQLCRCRYPEPVMREIRVLGKPLLGVDRFLHLGRRAREKLAAEGSSQAGGQTESSEKMTVGCSKHYACCGEVVDIQAFSEKKKFLAEKMLAAHKENCENGKEFNAYGSSEIKSKNRSSCMTPSYSMHDGQSFACQSMHELSLSDNVSSSSGQNSTNEKTNMASEKTCNKMIASSCNGSSVSVPRPSFPKMNIKCFDTRKLYGPPLILAFKAEFLLQLEAQDLVPAAAKSADLLRIPIKFKIVERPHFEQNAVFDCDFYLKDLVMASAQGSSKKVAKYNSVKTAHEMLISASDFVIKSNDDKKYVEPEKAEDLISNDRAASDSPKTFKLNYDLLYNTLLLKFVLFDNSENRPLDQRSALLVLNDSAKLCQIPLIYETVSTPESYTSVDIKLKEHLVGFATEKVAADARKIACEMALEKLSTEIYTIKVKKEDACGILITPQVIFNNRTCDILSSRNTEPDMFKVCCVEGDVASGFKNKHPEYHPSEPSLEDVRADQSLFQTLLSKIEELFSMYSTSKIFDDIIFSTEFSGRDRTEFSRIATSQNLQTLFRRENNLYYLRVRRKFSMTQILNHLVQSGGLSCQYILLDGEKEPMKL